MKTVFEPGNLFLSESDWYDAEKRDNFLQHLLENLDYINNYKITKIYWTDELEKLLWDSPQLPPWRLNRDWNLPIVQVIYRAFNTTQEFIQNSKNLTSCLVQPSLDCSEIGDLTLLAFLELMHIVIDRSENIYLCLGASRIKNDYFFSCDCHSFGITPLVIAKPTEWLNHINLASDYWPDSLDEIEKFQTALNIMFKKLNSKAIYEYEFSNAFLKDIIKTKTHREQIIEYAAKRLTLNQQEAAKDSYLKDEYLPQTKEHRFRVTQRPSSTRIHYKYVNKKFRFLRYYGEGEHDNGL
ncbi:MAG: hypothetical protein V7K48_19980 [Nostoc sp.]|uniref:hypothetical protein n=1 Tax=Nostoc sp. TaxID=1180 RepID=UPI002FF46C6A